MRGGGRHGGLSVLRSVTILCLGLFGGSLPIASAAPRLLSVEPLVLPGLPKAAEGLCAGPQGRLFVLDRVNGEVLVFDKEGRKIGSFGKGRIVAPRSITAAGSEVAVVEGRGSLLFFNGRTLSYEKTTAGLTRYCPGLGAALTPHRIVYGGMGYEGKRPERGETFDALVLFSTDWEGRDLRVCARRKVSWEEENSFQVLAGSHFFPLPGGGLAVARVFPPKIWLLDSEGRVVRQSQGGNEPLPRAPSEGRLPPDQEWDAIYFGTPHVEGLFAAGDRFALIVREHTQMGHVLYLSWYDKDLRPYQREPLRLPVVLGSDDFVRGTVSWGSNEILLLLVRRQERPWGIGSSRVFRLKFSHG